MAYLIIALLTIFAVAVVLYPFIRGGAAPGEPSGERSGLASSLHERESIYQEIRAIQLEYEIGTVQEEEYRRQLQAYRFQAAHSLRDQDAAELDQELEEQILALRTHFVTGGGDHHSPAVCPTCGSAITAPAGKCTQCGTGPGAHGGPSAGLDEGRATPP